MTKQFNTVASAEIRVMPSATYADYAAILRRYVLELRALDHQLINDMAGLASGDASMYSFAVLVAECAVLMRGTADTLEDHAKALYPPKKEES